MGEAKYRKQHDQTYGRIPQSEKNKERGIVLSSPIHIHQSSGSFSSTINADLLRRSLLFWDKLLWPKSNLIYLEGGPDENYLEKIGVLERPYIKVSESGDLVNLFATSYISFFNSLNNEHPGQWSLASGEDAFFWDNNPTNKLNSLQLNLMQAVPIPDIDMPFDEILNFKETRKDELRCFQAEIDAFVKEIFFSENKENAFNKKLKYIKQSSNDLINSAKEYKHPLKRISNFCAAFEFSELIKLIGIEALLALPFEIITDQVSLSPKSIACKVLTSSFIYMIKLQSQISFNNLLKNHPFAYIYNIHEKLK